MDARRFDALACTLTTAASRRRALTRLVSGTLGLVLSASSMEDAAAKKKTCPPCKKRKKGKCKKKLPDGTACGDGRTCQNGQCRCTPSCAPTDACGPDGCDGSYGTCNGGTCSATGVCRCDDPEEVCKGVRREGCFDMIRNTQTCGCCFPNGPGEAFSSLDDCILLCCSGDCIPHSTVAGQWMCTGRRGWPIVHVGRAVRKRRLPGQRRLRRIWLAGSGLRSWQAGRSPAQPPQLIFVDTFPLHTLAPSGIIHAASLGSTESAVQSSGSGVPGRTAAHGVDAGDLSPRIRSRLTQANAFGRPVHGVASP
jgi:hypothetical protein